MIIRALFLSGLLWVAVPQLCFSASGKKERYISQELIDTSIQRGFILLNESADMAGVGFRHQKSLTEAKKIVKTLREKARGDPNEKYVLWKVGELEAQIYLEEGDLIFQEMQKRQLTINELVAKYNTEVGKWRPDFASLYRIHKNMDQVDAGKGNELADSYNKRKRAISREVVYFLEKALLAGNADSARRELGYCLRNRLYLDVSESAYKKLEDRVEGLFRAREEKPFIDAGILEANRLLDKKNITEARRTLDTANGRLSDIKQHLPQRDAIVISSSFKRATDRLGIIEDSLVNVNLSILRAQGVEAADKYLQSVLRVHGVSHEKAANVDRMIIAVRSPDDGKPTAVDGLDTEGDEPEASPVLDDIMFAAKKKAQDKMDSLQAIENARLWKERQVQNRLDSIAQVARAAQEAQLRVKQLRADSVAMAVYAFVEKNDSKAAKNLLSKEDAFLGQFLRPDEFSMLKTTIAYFSEAPVEKKSEVTYLKPVEGKKAELPPAASDATLQTNLDRAQEEVVGIYSMLEKNDVDNAYRRFQTNKTPLRKYLAPEAFSMLEMSVKQAYEYFAGKR